MQIKTDNRDAMCAALEQYSKGQGEELVIVKNPTIEIKAPTPAGLIPVVASTEDKDRDEDIIRARGWDLKDFKKNPVIMWAHDYSMLPIGKAHNTRKGEGNLISEMEFTPHDLNPLGDTVGRMVKAGFLNTVSVGFKPTKFAPLEEEQGLFGGIEFLKQSLLEYSVVPIPSNPHALIGARAHGIDLAPIKEWTEKILDGESPARMWIPRDAAEEMRKACNTGRMFGLHHAEPRGELTDTKGIAVTITEPTAEEWAPDAEAFKHPTADEVRATIVEMRAEIDKLKSAITAKGEGAQAEDDDDKTASDADLSTESGEPPNLDAGGDDVPQPENTEDNGEDQKDFLDVVRAGIDAFNEERRQKDPLYGVALKLHTALHGGKVETENSGNAAKGESQ